MYAAASNLAVFSPALSYCIDNSFSEQGCTAPADGGGDGTAQGPPGSWGGGPGQACPAGEGAGPVLGPEGLLLPSGAGGTPDLKGGQGRSKKDDCSESPWNGGGEEGELEASPVSGTSGFQKS